jgi:hypothetical protein
MKKLELFRRHFGRDASVQSFQRFAPKLQGLKPVMGAM